MFLGPHKQKLHRLQAGFANEANRRQTGGYEYAVYTLYNVMTIVCKFMVMALTVMTFLYERRSACRCSSSFAAFSAFLTSYTKYSNHSDKQSSWTLLISLPMLVSTWPLEHTHFAMPQRSFSEQGRGQGGTSHNHKLQKLWSLQPLLAPLTLHVAISFDPVPYQHSALFMHSADESNSHLDTYLWRGQSARRHETTIQACVAAQSSTACIHAEAFS